MTSEPLIYQHDNSRTGFDCEHEEHFTYPLYKIEKFLSSKTLGCHIGEIYLGKVGKNNLFTFCCEKYGHLEGDFIIARMTKIADKRSYAEYLKTIDPINLRKDYYEGYLEKCAEFNIVPKLKP